MEVNQIDKSTEKTTRKRSTKSSSAVKEASKTTKPKTTKAKTTKSAPKKKPATKQNYSYNQEYYYEPSFFDKVLDFLAERWYAILVVIGLIVVNFVIPAMSESSDENSTNQFVGTYTYTDALNHRFIVTIKEGGNALVKMDRSTVGDSNIARIAWGDVMNGIHCIWDTTYASKGGEYIKGISVEGEGIELYFCDGDVYFDYSDFNRFRNGYRYHFQK